MITLGIIGIVAALTMPSLIAKYQKKALESQFKRVYSNIYNAIRLVEAKEGSIPLCYYTNLNNFTGNFTECNNFYYNLTKQMQVIKTCQGNAYNEGCIPKYEGVDTIKEYENNAIVTGCSGYKQTNILNRNWAYVLNDGTIIFTFGVPTIIGSYSGLFTIDVNGKKAPNKWGYDLFSFAFYETKPGILKMISACSLTEKGGRSSEKILSNIKD